MQVDRPTQSEWEETLVPGLGRIRDVREGPDGYIYLAVEGGTGTTTLIVRLEPATSTNLTVEPSVWIYRLRVKGRTRFPTLVPATPPCGRVGSTASGTIL